jgi:hypothetical protein
MNGVPSEFENLYKCRLCGAALEVQVRFRGKLVWVVPEGDPDFGAVEPELRGEHKNPRLVCSADVLHKTGFRLVEGQIEPAGEADD